MFTGIVTHRGRIEAANRRADGSVVLSVLPEPVLTAAVGDSVAVDGVCLTVTSCEGGRLTFDAVPETLRKTTLGARVPGAQVNLEVALRAGDALGGHWVQGHVDGVGHVTAVEQEGDDVRMAIAVPDGLHEGMLPKGSVTLDGVSLTVGEVWREPEGERPARFSVYLIPHTLEVTGLGSLGVGDSVNVEADILGRWVLHHVRRLLADSPVTRTPGPNGP